MEIWRFVLIVRFQSSPLTLVLCSSHEIHKGLRQSSQKAAVLSERPPRAHTASQSWAQTLLRGRGEDAGQQGRTRSCRSRLRNITQLAGKANPWCQRSDRKSAAPGTLRGRRGRAESSVTELEELRDGSVRQRGLNEALTLHCMVSLFLTLSPFLCHAPFCSSCIYLVQRHTLEANDLRFPWEPIDYQMK